MSALVDVGQKVDGNAFIISAIILMAVAVFMAVIRLYSRHIHFKRFFSDDWLFLAANIFLIASSATIFMVLPYNRTQVEVANKVRPKPPDFITQIDMNTKLQDVSALLNNASIFSVKFSFLFFFRRLMGKSAPSLRRYWWFVFIFTIPCAIVCMLSNFLVCPAFGPRILQVCVGSASGRIRANAILYTLVALDVTTDILLVVIPVGLLWKIKINWRRKAGFGWLLCLSALAVITNIIRGAGHNLRNGAPDIAWIIYWAHVEACVAVMANAMTAFKALFNTSPAGAEPKRFLIQKRSKAPQIPQIGMPSLPSAQISGIRTLFLKDPFEDNPTTASEETYGVASTTSVKNEGSLQSV